MGEEDRYFILLAYPDEGSQRAALEAMRRSVLFRHRNDGAAIGPLEHVVPLLIRNLEDAERLVAAAEAVMQPTNRNRP